jgi:hypothetical protein
MTINIVSIAPAIPGVRDKVDRILESVWAPPDGPVPNLDDSVLIAAVKEFRKLQKFSDRLERARRRKEHGAVSRATEREMDRLDARWNALFEFIYRTPAAGLTGAVVKLRMLTERDIGLSEQDEVEGEALRDVLRIVERELKARQDGR